MQTRTADGGLTSNQKSLFICVYLRSSAVKTICSSCLIERYWAFRLLAQKLATEMIPGSPPGTRDERLQMLPGRLRSTQKGLGNMPS
ncbi:MAG: hypothetical protein NTV46_22410 [Verrucomicrobia bacterium]|nr:hypothetical protein [Verrucomicrobiota bacterium]